MARENFPLPIATVTDDMFNKWTQLIQIQSAPDYLRMNCSVSGFSVHWCRATRAGSAWTGFVSGGVQACWGWAHNMFLTAFQVPAGESPCSSLSSSPALFPLNPCCVFLMAKCYVYLVLYVVLGYPGYTTPSESESI